MIRKLIVLSFVEDHCHVIDLDTELVISSAVFYDATPRRDVFLVYKVWDFDRMKISNTSYADIVSISDVYVQINVGCTLTLKYAWHVPDLCMNLIVTHSIDLDGYYKSFDDKKWKLTKRSILITKGRLCHKLYNT